MCIHLLMKKILNIYLTCKQNEEIQEINDEKRRSMKFLIISVAVKILRQKSNCERFQKVLITIMGTSLKDILVRFVSII